MMLYSCTQMATVSIKGLSYIHTSEIKTAYIQFCFIYTWIHIHTCNECGTSNTTQSSLQTVQFVCNSCAEVFKIISLNIFVVAFTFAVTIVSPIGIGESWAPSENSYVVTIVQLIHTILYCPEHLKLVLIIKTCIIIY